MSIDWIVVTTFHYAEGPDDEPDLYLPEQRTTRLRVAHISAYESRGDGHTSIFTTSCDELIAKGDITRQLDALLKPHSLHEVL